MYKIEHAYNYIYKVYILYIVYTEYIHKISMHVLKFNCIKKTIILQN